jgi:hypothetical protein
MPNRVYDADNGWATVIAVDPGGTTGWCVMCVEPDCLSDPDVSVLQSISHYAWGQVDGEENGQAHALVDLIAAWPHAAVVFENFTLRTFKQSRELLSPVRITAKVDYVLHRGIEDVYPAGRRIWLQEPSMAKSTATDDRLKDWGLYRREGGQEHARDATRHAITFLRRASDRPNLRHNAWPTLYDKAGDLDG